MKRLYLLRHAKSSWKDATLADHDRPLNGRGRRAAKTIAGRLREEGIEPDLVLCSSARRARETLDRIELRSSTVRVEASLYAASAHALLERLRRVPETVESVMLIGHNPGLRELALDLARPSPAADELAAKYPTAALATLECPSWHKLRHGTAELVELVRERRTVLLDPEAPRRLVDAVPRDVDDLVLVVGPEGGVSPEETAALTAAGAEVFASTAALVARCAALFGRAA
jgi:phosphohistidine phosphatase